MAKGQRPFVLGRPLPPPHRLFVHVQSVSVGLFFPLRGEQLSCIVARVAAGQGTCRRDITDVVCRVRSTAQAECVQSGRLHSCTRVKEHGDLTHSRKCDLRLWREPGKKNTFIASFVST